MSASKPKKEKKISVRFIKRKEKESKKELPIPQIKPFIPRDVFLKDAPDIIEGMTKSGICASPSYYLDHAKKCDGCTFFDNCYCALKEAA